MTTRLHAALAAPGHVGLWPGLYVTAAYVFFWQLADAGRPLTTDLPALEMLAAVLLASVGVYAFDRVKLTSARIDPADVAAQPVRYAFLKRHARTVRVLALALIAIAMLIAHLASVLMPLVIATALLGVIIYAPGPRKSRPRLKDLLIVKNLYAAAGVVAFAIVATLMIGPLSRAGAEAFWRLLPDRLQTLLPAAALLMGRVTIDAMLCDIDDTLTDAAHGTRTLPGIVGAGRTLALGVVLRLLLAGMLPLLAKAPLNVTLTWAGVSACSALLLVPLRRRALRDIVDVAFAIEAIVVIAVVRLG